MKHEITQKEWELFSTILEKIIEMELPVDDKTLLVTDKVCECLGKDRGETTLEEFNSWLFEF